MKRNTSTLDENRKLVADRVKKFEQAAHEIHELADKMNKKMEELHMETVATRDRARAAREQAEKTTGSVKSGSDKSPGKES